MFMMSANLRYPLAIALGAIAGALSRYYISLWFVQKFGTSFPYATMVINLSGCLLMGLAITWFGQRLEPIAPEIQILVTTGFLGAYTTFSTYGLESVALFKQAGITPGISYWLGSAIAGIVCVQIGIWLARLLP
jgi:CrcB protein